MGVPYLYVRVIRFEMTPKVDNLDMVVLGVPDPYARVIRFEMTPKVENL